MINQSESVNKTVTIPESANFLRFTPEKPATSPRWQQELSQAIRSPAELLARLNLPAEDEHHPQQVTQNFPLLVTESFLSRIEPGNRRDPLLLQVLPDIAETVEQEGFTADAVGDTRAHLTPGILQKYHGRALLVLTGQCAIHCRYCFRRSYPYAESPASLEKWEAEIDQLQNDSDIEEVILSGGDPLIWSDRRLAQLIQHIERLPQIQRLRIHSRLPVVLPSRMTETLLQLLKQTRLQTILVIHANHPRELTADAAEAIKMTVQTGIPVLNQAVLLKGINDHTSIQAELCRRLINLGAIPYYLHQLDRVTGAAHFEVDPAIGKQIMSELKSILPGYAVPKYVQEIPGASSKTELIG